jgi:hypothetical protein
MTVGDSVSIEETLRDGFVTDFGYPIVREDGVYFPARWHRDWEDAEHEAPSGSMLVHIDPETDKVTVTSDDRCTGMLVSKTMENGDTYWFSDNYNAYSRIVWGDDHGVPDCALRLRKGESSFDPDWSLEIDERTDGAPAVGVIAGADSTMWLRVFQKDALSTPPEDIDSVDTASAWQWYSLDLADDGAAVEDDSRPLSSHGAFATYSGGRSFTTIENAGYTETKLVELTDDGFVERAKVKGLLDGIVRVR